MQSLATARPHDRYIRALRRRARIAASAIVNDSVARRVPLCSPRHACLAQPAARPFASEPDIQKLEIEIHRIEANNQREIGALRSELHQLRREKASGHTYYVTKDEPASNGGPHVIESTKNGVHFGFADESGLNTVELFGRWQLDVGGYPGYRPAPGNVNQTGGHDGIDLRRARLGVIGNLMGDWHYAFIYDLGNTSDSLNPNNGLASDTGKSAAGATSTNYLSGIQTALITYNGFYSHGQQYPVAFDFGFQDTPFTLDEATSSADLMFMERATPTNIATSFGAGDYRSSLGVRSATDRYWLGGYLTGPNAGSLHANAPCVYTGATSSSSCIAHPVGGLQLGAFLRGTYQVWQTQDSSVHVGFNYANFFSPRTSSNGEGISLSDRPELRVDPTSYLNLGDIPAHGGQVFGGEAAAAWQNFYVQGEYYHYMIATKVANYAEAGTLTSDGFADGRNGPTVNANGGYVQASYSFGGRRHYNVNTGAYTGVIPEHPLAYGSDGFGAVELAGRFSIVDLNSSALEQLYQTKTPGYTGYTGGRQTAYGAGINWYPNGNLKFMLDYEHVIVDDPAAFDGPNSKGATIDWIGGRTQVTF